ncbi:MobF family relaxase [Pseudomonas savastanoi]|uniref:MobF family relaxase n=1 Tax=Pseudomonas savastanoi TaxID=29438 RepID=UPI000E32C1E2|nr:MobF family relaxase [Pseudomonas savastanoi]
MIDITTITRQSFGKVVSYYADGADDYYAKDGTSMQWQGEGAEALGLSGEVDQKRFRELLEGKIDEKTHLKRSSSEGTNKERIGYDLTFSAPKGVSLQALVDGDQRIIAAHDKAVTAAVREAEMLAKARHTVNKKTSVKDTKNLVVAKFRHETSRALDPDLHTHAFVMNMTQRDDGEWRALMNDAIINSSMHIGNVYKAELAKELEKAGFVLRYERNGTFDLAHFSDHQIKEFSSRSQQIEEALAKKGLDRSTASHAEKNQAALATRDKKAPNVDREELRKVWQARSRDLGIDYKSREWAGEGGHGPDDKGRSPTPSPQFEKPLEWHADKTLEFAIQSLTERKAVITEKELMDTAMKHGFGRLNVDDIRAGIERRQESGHLIKEEPLYSSAKAENDKAGKTRKGAENPAKAPALLSRKEWVDQLVKSGRARSEAVKLVDSGIKSGRLKKGDARFTTHIAQRRERDILALERMGRGKFESKISPEKVKGFLDDRTLNAEQGKAVSQIVQGRNQFMAVQGYAGVGKSFMTTAARDLLEENGYKVTALAPYGSQKKALEEEGIEARTVASFLKAQDKKIDKDTVVFIDEAGVIPARQMNEIMKVIEQAGARAVFLGDIAQTKAIEAGKPFEQLMKAGMETARMEDIQRQKNPVLLEAVKLAAAGDAKGSLEKIAKITEVKEDGDRYNQIVQSYVNLPKAERANALVITGTNDSRQQINAGIRRGLGLEGKGQDFHLLNRLDTTQAERRHSKYYEKGAIIVPDQDYKNGLMRGEQYKVLDTGPGNRLTVENAAGERIQFSPAQCTKLSVYRNEKSELAVGDWVKITRNDKTLDLANGDRFIVSEIRDDKIILTDGKPGSEDPERKLGRVEIDASQSIFMGYAYASTVHSAQGLTCDKVLVNLETESKTTAKDVYYVAVSRARHEAELFTDNAGKLGNAVSRLNIKDAALDIKQLSKHAQPKTKTVENSTPEKQVKETGVAHSKRQKGDDRSIGL